MIKNNHLCDILCPRKFKEIQQINVQLGDQMGDQKLLNQRFVDTVIKPGKYFDKNGLFLRVKPGGLKKMGF